MGRFLSSILVLTLIVFVGALGYFYIQEGSFEGAGQRMDTELAQAAEKTERAVNEAGDATEDFVEDLSDGDSVSNQ
ncbi:MAG: hypothetical protein CMK09_15195 [Ponticaulis sp.]|nr:hypothetical protein [Ponticaulis sp.]